jgi:glycosyltransferase 2 family protein
MKHKVFLAIKLAITVLIFVFIFSNPKMNLRQFIITLSNARINILIAGFLVLWLGHYICIYRWRILMRPLMSIPSVRNLLGIYCIGLYFNMILPSLIGGDVVKIYYAGRPSKKYAQSFAAAFLDRDAGMFAMMIIACIAVLISPITVPGVHVSVIIWSVFIAFVFGNIAIFVPRFHRLLTDMLHRLNLSKIATKVDMISSAFQIMGKHKGVLLWSLIISFVNQLLVIAVTWITALGLQLDISFFHFLIFVPVVTLISMIPISISGLGLRESSFEILLRSVGAPPASGIALGLISSLFLFLTSLPGGIVYIFFKNRTDKQQLAALETEFS